MVESSDKKLAAFHKADKIYTFIFTTNGSAAKEHLDNEDKKQGAAAQVTPQGGEPGNLYSFKSSRAFIKAFAPTEDEFK